MSRFAIIGGDRRQMYLAWLLHRAGHEVRTCALPLCEGIEDIPLCRTAEAECVVLPMPLEREKGCLNAAGHTVPLDELWSALRPQQRIFAGGVDADAYRQAQERGLTLCDYAKDEALAVRNAVPTAEGALLTAMERLEETLCHQNVLILGGGRIASALAPRLRALGACVTLAVRKAEDIARFDGMGCTALPIDALDGTLAAFRVVYNTVPALMLDEALLAQLSRGCLLIDLASVQGFDKEAAQRMGLETVWARGLPGRTAPLSAAKSIYDTIIALMEEKRV